MDPTRVAAVPQSLAAQISETLRHYDGVAIWKKPV
jgi:hypothetical protein